MKTFPCSSIKPIVPWVDLPPELLSLITSSLGIIDLLSFRGVCKDWRLAPCTASAEVESDPSSKPWFILFGETEYCTLYNPNDKIYSINFPELKHSTCLASNQGWLLLFQEGSIFFFCPFSQARIDLPWFPHQEISEHIAAFSCPPTSLECIVSIINRCDENTLEINVLKRGENAWTTHTFELNKQSFGTIIGGIFDDEMGTFYYLDNASQTLTFSMEASKETNYVIYQIVTDSPDDKSVGYLPFCFEKSYFRHSDLQDRIGLKDEFSISICGAIIRGHGVNILINNECIEASNRSEKCQMKGIWIQPRFFKIPTTQSW
ncbi:F-box protein At3g56470-like [Olea europaea var. sylvestris]|uniref:F-box protein At3g56470-like n=1 Tax=Olea europaea var. sylvestris TaxID=158386 RepID=UPI000C1CE090|nr:F-box protein At3g56470-like [Olea europaea var. sylvestris]